MQRKTKLALVAIALCAISAISIAYAAFTILTSTLKVYATYTLSGFSAVEEASPNQDTYDLSVTLTKSSAGGGAVAISGATIHWMVSINGGDWTEDSTSTTDASGVATSTYTITGSADYQFKATYTFPTDGGTPMPGNGA